MIFVFLLILVKSLVWAFVVPVFQTPDEQAHFAQLQWYAEKRNFTLDYKNLSLEVATAEELLGTRRDQFGNNKYTYHPEYKNNAVVPVMPLSARTIYVDNEAAGYPPLYYVLSMPFYFSVYNQGLTDRIFASRLLPILLNLALALVAYKIGKIVWSDNLFALALAVLVTFQPMVSFVSAGIHPDNLLNLLYSVGILLLLLILKNGVKTKYLLFLALVFFLGLETKILMVFFLPVAVAVVLWRRFPVLAVAVLIAPVAAFIFRWPLPYMPVVTPASPLAKMDLGEYLRFRGPKTLFEMWPWYWGVFKWLGVTLPPLVMKIITRFVLLAGIGLIIRLWRKTGFEFKALVFFLLSTVFYFLYLIFWDWRLMQSIGFSQGLQGRYLFTNIVPQMALILSGLTVIKRFEKVATVVLMVGMVALNLVALYTVFQSYYTF